MSKSSFFCIAFLLVAMTPLMAAETPVEHGGPLAQKSAPKPSFAQRLKLSKAQREQWNAIDREYKKKEIEFQENFEKEVDAILTPAQRAQMQKVSQLRSATGKNASKKPPRSGVNDLNLTKAQQERWMTLFRKNKQAAVILLHQRSDEIDAILTPAQREVIRQENERRTQAVEQHIMQNGAKEAKQ